MVTVRLISKSPNGNAIAPFLQTLAAVARRLPTQAQLQHYMDLCLLLLERTSGSIPPASIKPTPVQVCDFF